MSAHGERFHWTNTGGQPQAPAARRITIAPAVEAPTLRQIQGRCRAIIRKGELLCRRGYSHRGEHEDFSSDLGRLSGYMRIIEENGFQLPFCPLLKKNDIRAVMRAFTDGWGSGKTKREMISNVRFLALSLAVSGDSFDLHCEVVNEMTGREETCKAVEGDPNVVIGPRALQFNRFLSYMIAVYTFGDVLLNRLLKSGESNPLSKQEKLALSKAINEMKNNFPRKVREKVYRGPKAEDEYTPRRRPFKYHRSDSFRKVLEKLMRRINLDINEPIKFVSNGDKTNIMRALKRVSDETEEIMGASRRQERDESAGERLLTTYLNALLLFSHNQFMEGTNHLNDLLNELIDCWSTERIGRNRPGSNRSGSDSYG